MRDVEFASRFPAYQADEPGETPDAQLALP